MGRASLIQTNFTGGELSPALALGRVDIAKYNNGVRRLENCVLTVQGGAKRRPGTRYIAPTKYSDRKARLIEFVFNRGQAYVLELGDGYLRFFKDRVRLGAPYELTSPYTQAQLPAVNYVQKADTAFFVHEAVYPYRLQRYGDISWGFGAVPFIQAAYEEQGHFPGSALTLSHIGPGAATVTGAAFFLDSDVGRTISSSGGFGVITGYTSATVVTLDIITPFKLVGLPAGTWNLGGSPQATVTPSAVGVVGATIDLNSGSLSAWRTDDIGSYVSINGGLGQIVSISTSALAHIRVIRSLSATVAAGPNAWTLEQNAWNSQKGYPRAVSINKQRLLYGGSPGYPQHIWASEIQGYLNFSFGTADDEAFRFELDGPRNSPIRHIAPSRQLLVLTESDEMSLKGGQEKPITPTNIQKTDESTVGAGSARPVKVGNEILFVQAARKKVSACGYKYEVDGFASPDRTVFASHITGSGVSQIAHQKEPNSTLFAVRDDGILAVCAYDVEQEVTGWGRWITNGAFESIAVAPTPTGEDAYAIVNRTITGVPKRYVEVFDQDMLVDCGISGTHPTGQATWSGLGHLESETVQAWADGSYLGEYVVAGGQVTLTRPARSVQIGLPFTSLVEMLQPEVSGNGTTAQGSQVHVNEVILRVLDTASVVINGETQDFRRFGSELLDQPPPIYSGDVRAITLSDSIFTTSQIIEQRLPLPFHLLDVIRRVTINE